MQITATAIYRDDCEGANFAIIWSHDGDKFVPNKPGAASHTTAAALAHALRTDGNDNLVTTAFEYDGVPMTEEDWVAASDE